MTLTLPQKQQLAVALLAKTTRQTPHLPLLPWTVLHRRRIDNKTFFDLLKHPYLSEIYQQTAQEIVVKKAAQMGLSEWLISYALHACDQRNLDVLYVMPSDGDVSDFSQSRFGPALEASPYINSLVVGGAMAQEGAQNKVRGSDKVTLKKIRNSFLYFRGGKIKRDGRGVNKARQLKSIPADCLILDELDEMDRQAPEIARKRLGHSEVAEVREISTPSYPGMAIDAEWERSDQREWMLPCPGCGHWQLITLEHIVIEQDDLERPVAWHGQDEGRAFAACEKCGKELDRLAQGRWVARYPEREIVGYHPTKLHGVFVDLLEIVKALISVDETKRRETINQDLGETYTPRGGQLTAEVLDDCRREYGHGPKLDTGAFMGVDVGKVLHTVIRGERDALDGTWPQLYADEVESFERLTPLIKQFKIKKVVIDAQPETHKVREFQASQPPGMVWLAYYPDSDGKHAESANWNENEGTVILDRTRSLDETFARFYDSENTLPANARDIKDYYAQMIAPVRVLETKRNGATVARYIEGSKDDHFTHAENYCRAAMTAPVVVPRTAVSRSVSASEL